LAIVVGPEQSLPYQQAESGEVLESGFMAPFLGLFSALYLARRLQVRIEEQIRWRQWMVVQEQGDTSVLQEEHGPVFEPEKRAMSRFCPPFST
jgi:hypothetical protein